MKIRGQLGLALIATLFASATALAQSTDDPNTTTTTTTTTTQPAQPAQPTSSTTVVVQPTTPPAQPPPVVETPPQPPPPVVVPMANRVPVTEETEDEWNAPMFTTGALVFAGSYGASVIVASSSDRQGDDRLYVPVVGPWLDLADRGSCPVEQQSCDHETTAKVLLVADGVFQAAGVLAMIDGLFVPVHHHVTTQEAIRDYKKVHVAPVSYGQASPGFAVMGHF